jgi:hypothetical protein
MGFLDSWKKKKELTDEQKQDQQIKAFNMFKDDVTTPVDTTTLIDSSVANQTGLANLLKDPSNQDFTLHQSSAALGDGYPGILGSESGGAGYTGSMDPGALQQVLAPSGCGPISIQRAGASGVMPIY